MLKPGKKLRPLTLHRYVQGYIHLTNVAINYY